MVTHNYLVSPNWGATCCYSIFLRSAMPAAQCASRWRSGWRRGRRGRPRDPGRQSWPWRASGRGRLRAAPFARLRCAARSGGASPNSLRCAPFRQRRRVRQRSALRAPPPALRCSPRPMSRQGQPRRPGWRGPGWWGKKSEVRSRRRSRTPCRHITAIAIGPTSPLVGDEPIVLSWRYCDRVAGQPLPLDEVVLGRRQSERRIHRT